MRMEGKKEKQILSCSFHFLCSLICLTLRKSISDDNPQASNESRGAPLPWESLCWRMSLILAK